MARVKLSEAAKSALMSTGSNRQGRTPTHPMSEAVRRELNAAGMLGERDGLTRKGSIERERLSNDIPF